MSLRKRMQRFYDMGRDAALAGVPPNSGAFYDKDSRWLVMAYYAGYHDEVKHAKAVARLASAAFIEGDAGG